MSEQPIGVWVTKPDGSSICLYEPNPIQIEFHSRSEANVLMWGNRGGGKSMALRWDAHMRALANPKFHYVILRRTYPELEKSHLNHIPYEISMLGGTYNKTLKTVTYPNGAIGRFSQCEAEEDVLKLLSAEFSWMGFDEITTFNWEHVTKLGASVRAPKGTGLIPMVRAATNPLGPCAMEVRQFFIDKDVDLGENPDYNPNDWYSIRIDLKDNPHLDIEVYSKRFQSLPAHVRKAWVEGEFALENALFDFHPMGNGGDYGELGRPYHVIHDIDLKKVLDNAVVYRALDAGWFPDPTVCLWIAHLGNRHIVFNEETWYKTTAVEIASDIKRIDKELGVKVVATTYCDPSMDINTSADIRTLKELYEDNGIPMENSINNREMYATVIHNSLAEQAGENLPRLQVYVNGLQGCPMLVKTLPQMRFDDKHPKAMADHKNDHWVVALAYYLLSHSADPRTSISGSWFKLRPWMKPKPETKH